MAKITFDPAQLTVATEQARAARGSSGGIAPFWEFVGALENVAAGKLVGLWLPQQGNTTTTTSKPGDRVWTYDATIASRLAAQGYGVTVSFNGTDQFATSPDTTDLSFGDGTTDSAFSIAALANVTDTAGARCIASKIVTSGATGEWFFQVQGNDALRLLLCDTSVPAQPFRESNAGITQGAPHLFGASYDATGGASAANGIVLFQDGASIASTATNVGTYVAMENGTVQASIGSFNGSTSDPFSGTLGFIAIYAANLNAAQHLAIKQAVNKFYALVL